MDIAGGTTTLSRPEGIRSQENPEMGRAAEYTPDDLQFIGKVSEQVDEAFDTEKNIFIDGITRQKLGSQELVEYLEKGEITLEFVEIVDRYEPLTELVEAGVIIGPQYIEALDLIRKKEPFSLELERLIVAAKEIRELASENVIKPKDRKAFLKAYAPEVQGQQPGKVAGVLKNYETFMVRQAEAAAQNGVVREDELINMRNYYTLESVTIMGTPREIKIESEMAWSILAPTLDKVRTWRKLNELKQSELIRENHYVVSQQALAVGEGMPGKVTNLITGLDKLHYARFCGVINNEEEYKRALRLLPLMTVKQSSVNLEPDDITSEIALEEYSGFSNRIENPLDDQKRMLTILIEAWEAALGWSFKEEFSSILEGTSIQNYSQAHSFLVKLNGEYAQDQRPRDEKRMDYLTKMRVFIATLSG